MSAVSCERHPFDVAHERCRSCRNDFCEACLVYTHGPKRPPLCIPCALVAAGIRHGNRPHARRRRGLFGRGERELVNAGGVPAAESADTAAAPAPEAAAPPPPPPAAPAPVPVPVGDEEGPTVIPGLRVDW